MIQQKNGARKWCEYCRINVPANRAELMNHENSRTHIKNKQRHIDFESKKNQKIHFEQSQKEHEASEAQNYSASDIESADIKSEVYQNLRDQTKSLNEQYRIEIQNNGTYQTIYDGSQAVSLQKQIDSVWSMVTDEDTGYYCFQNNLSGEVQFQQPHGLKLSADEENLWDQQITRLLKEKEEDEDPQKQKKGKAGSWSEVVEQEDFFEQNAISQSEESSQFDDDDDSENGGIEGSNLRKGASDVVFEEIQTQDEQLQEIGEQIDKGQQNFDQNVLNLILDNEAGRRQDKISSKNQKLKKLVENNFELPITFQKPQYTFHQDAKPKQETNTNVEQALFQKRVLNNKAVLQITNDDEDGDQDK